MNNKDIMAVMAEVYNRLYRTSFHGEQAMVVVDCERILMNAMRKMNESAGGQSVDTEGSHVQK